MLYGWPVVAIFLFAWLRQKHWAVIWTVVLGALFLPEVQLSSVDKERAPDANSLMLYVIVKATKPNMIAFSLLVASFLLDGKRLFSFRPRWYDIPMLVWCVIPMVSNLMIPEDQPTRHRPYDCIMASRDQVWFWGFAYYFGRIYFRTAEELRDLALGFVYGGLLYSPLFLIECWVFPRFHEDFYGFFPGDKNECFRLGGYRPVLFMSHGLATSLFMWAAAIAAVWLWWSGAVTELKWLPKRKPAPMAWVAGFLVFLAVGTRSTGAIILGTACLAALFQLRWMRQPILLAALLAFPPIQMLLRSTVNWEDPAKMARRSTDPADASFSESIMAQFMSWDSVLERRGSLAFREINENYLIRKIWNQPYFGYGDTGLARIVPEMHVKKEDPIEAVTDSFWIITLSCYGAVGLVAVYAAMLLPVLRYMYYYKPYRWDQPLYAAGAALGMILLLWMLDNLYNGFFNALYVLTAGALASVTGNLRAASPAPPAQAQAGGPAEPYREARPLGRPTAVPPRAGVLPRGRPLPK
jgi:hypothetical protein